MIYSRGHGFCEPVFPIGQDPIDHETFHEKDFRGCSYFDVYRHPDTIIDARLLHGYARPAQHACQK